MLKGQQCILRNIFGTQVPPDLAHIHEAIRNAPNEAKTDAQNASKAIINF